MSILKGGTESQVRGMDVLSRSLTKRKNAQCRPWSFATDALGGRSVGRFHVLRLRSLGWQPGDQYADRARDRWKWSAAGAPNLTRVC